MLGLLSLYFDKPLILINRQLDKQTKQMVCGYALGHYLEHQLLMDLHTLNKFLTIKDKHYHFSSFYKYSVLYLLFFCTNYREPKMCLAYPRGMFCLHESNFL